MTCTGLFFAAVLSVSCSFSLYSKDKHPKNLPTTPQDDIETVAHVPLTGGAVTRFLETQHYRRNYLYAEHESGKTVSLIDVTSARQPALLPDVTFPNGASDSLVAVAGSAALVSSQTATVNSNPERTFRIMSFADPLHPTVKQEFDHVTAISYDDKRGLIFLANDSGVWILKQQYAMDPEEAKLQREIERSIYDTP
jgi:hypothetical protein